MRLLSIQRLRLLSIHSFFVGAGSLTALLLASTADAEPPAPANAAFEHKPKPPSDQVALQLEDAELGELVRVIGELTGKRFVIASPKLAKVKASVYAPQKVTVAEAYQAFLAVLTANGLTVVPQAGFYKIVESADVARQLTPLERGELSNEERYVTRIHRLAHLPAEEVATSVLAKLQTKDASVVPYNNLLIITETAANLKRMLEVLAVIDEGGEEDKIWLRPVKYLSAAQAEKQLHDMLGTKSKDGAAAKPEATVLGGALHVGRLVALERPNAIVLVGTRESFDRITKILDVIDVAPSNEIKVTVVPLQHSDAKKLVGPINEALGTAQAQVQSVQRSAGAQAAPPQAGSVLEAAVKVAADETTNSLIVTATARDYTYVMEMIRALDKPKRQVFIEAAILDISAERGMDVGVAWHGGHVHDAAIRPNGSDAQQTTYGGFRAASSALAPSATDLQAFALGVRGPDIPFLAGIPGVSKIPSFGAFLSAIATQKGADILSTPTIIASDNTMAEIKVQLQTSLQPNAPSFSPSLFGAPGGTPGVPGLPGAVPTSSNVAANYKGIGPHVKVTPHLNDSDEVRLDVVEVISDIQSAPAPGDTFGTVSYIERTATTTLTVKDGRTVVIGGLVRNRVSRTETKVPILGDIPLLGMLFRTRGDKLEKSNLVLVLTPHIIRDEADMRRIYERKMEERQELIDREAVFKGTEWAAPRDWTKTRGLLAHIKASQRDVVARRKEAEEREPKAVAAAPVVPLDLPVPQTPQSPAPPPRNASPPPATPAVGAVPTAARPAVIEK